MTVIVLKCSRCCHDVATLTQILLQYDYNYVAIRIHGDVATHILNRSEQLREVALMKIPIRFDYDLVASTPGFYCALVISDSIRVAFAKMSNRS